MSPHDRQHDRDEPQGYRNYHERPHDLQPIEPREAYLWYLEEREGDDDYSESTVTAHKYRLGHFIRWCEDEENLHNLNNITGRQLARFKRWRKNEGDLNKVSVHTQLSTLKVFLKWAEKIEAVKLGMFEYVQPPKLRGGDDVREKFIDGEFVADILSYYEKYAYASIEHVSMNLLWATGMRIGALRAIDIQDYHPTLARIELYHRPETDTPLKKKDKGERHVAVNDPLCELIDDYIAHNRHDVVDKYGRDPLLTTSHGRPHVNTLRDTVYKATRPCIITGEGCPGDEDPETCKAAANKTKANKCPYNYSPHAIRKGSITWALKNDVPAEKVAARMNVSAKALEKHYDMQTKEESMEARRDYFDDIY
jgi:site-specific recombinase XerD